MNETRKAVMLPTQKSNNVGDIVMRPSDRRLATINVLTVDDPNRDEAINQHLYIISNDDIKSGDYFICIKNECLQRADDNYEQTCDSDKKVIATTDRTLLKNFNRGGDGGYTLFPLIPESFTKVYINKHNDGEPIFEVDVEMEKYGYCGACRAVGMWHCANADTCGNAQELWRLKTREDGTIILRQSKKYSREEIRKILINYSFAMGLNPIGGAKFDNWFAENL